MQAEDKQGQRNWIVGLGEALFDIFPDQRQVLGGAPLNVAFHASQLPLPANLQVAMVSRIGTDPLGSKILNELSARNISLDGMQRDPERPTGIVQVEIKEGEPRYTIVKEVAWDFLEWSPLLEKMAKETRAVCYGSLGQRSPQSQETIREFLKNATDAIRLFDINLRPPYCDESILRNGCQLASMIKCNEDELSTLFNLHRYPWLEGSQLTDPSAILNSIEGLRKQLGLSAIMLTRSEKGCMIASERGCAIGEPAKMAQAMGADPVGAGDATSAVLLLGWLQNWPIQRIVDSANRLGAYVASQPGATPRIPSEILQEFQ